MEYRICIIFFSVHAKKNPQKCNIENKFTTVTVIIPLHEHIADLYACSAKDVQI